MPVVYSLAEARDWFLSHSSGSVKCVRGNNSAIVDSYPDAEKFFS